MSFTSRSVSVVLDPLPVEDEFVFGELKPTVFPRAFAVVVGAVTGDSGASWQRQVALPHVIRRVSGLRTRCAALERRIAPHSSVTLRCRSIRCFTSLGRQEWSIKQTMNCLRGSFAPYWQSIQSSRWTRPLGPGNSSVRGQSSSGFPGASGRRTASAQGPRGTGAEPSWPRRSTTCRRRACCWTAWSPTWRCGGSAAGSGRARCRASRSSHAPSPSSPTHSCPSARMQRSATPTTTGWWVPRLDVDRARTRPIRRSFDRQALTLPALASRPRVDYKSTGSNLAWHLTATNRWRPCRPSERPICMTCGRRLRRGTDPPARTRPVD